MTWTAKHWRQGDMKAMRTCRLSVGAWRVLSVKVWTGGTVECSHTVQFQIVGRNLVKTWHLQRRKLHTNGCSQSSYGQAGNDIEEQHQLPCQIQSLQIAGRLHPPPQASNLDTADWGRKKIQVFKNKCLWKLLGIFYWDHKTTSLKVSWADRNIFSPLLNERCHGLATSQCITASARPGTVEGEHNRGQQGWSKIMTCQFWNASVPPTPDYPGGGFRFLQPLGLSNDWSSQETDDMNQL